LGSEREEVQQILHSVGGKENIESVIHCMTRLRFQLFDEEKIDLKRIDEIDLVKGSYSKNGQFQLIIGPGVVSRVYEFLIEELEGYPDLQNEPIDSQSLLQKSIHTLADIFIPLLPAIVTAGLLLGLNNVLTEPWIFYPKKSFIDVHPEWTGIASMINLIANTSFTFLPALIGWSAVKRFGGSPILGIVLGLILVHPDLLSAYSYGDPNAEGKIPVWNVFGFDIQKIGYQGQILPVLIASYLLAKIEMFLSKRVHDSIKLLIVPPISLLITGIAAFIVIGPLTYWIGNELTSGLIAIFYYVPWLGGLIYGSFYAVLVVTGLHHAFLAVDLQLIGSTGDTFLWPILALSNIAQGSAAFAMYFVVKNQNMKGLATTSGISAYLGITEPAMFGINLRYRYPFYSALLGSGIAGMLLSLYQVKAFSIGIGGIPGFLTIHHSYWPIFFLGMAIVIVIPFILTIIVGKWKDHKK
jgi:PTS system trehalose-specific IIC component